LAVRGAGASSDHGCMRGRRATKVFIKASQWGLEFAIARTLAIAFGERIMVAIGEPSARDRGGIVVTTDASCSVAEVSKLSAAGHRVLVLVALPGELAELAYRRAGACGYLAMVASAAPLLSAVEGLMPSSGAAAA